MKQGLCVFAFVFVVNVGAGYAQQGQPSLGELAKQTEASRASAKKATKTYTNSNLNAEPKAADSDAKAPTGGFMSASLGKEVSAEEIVKRSAEIADEKSGAKLPEEYWRKRADFLRKEADRAQTMLVTYRRPTDSDVTKAANDREIVKIGQMLQGLAKQWDRLDESARVANVNPDWIGPRPNFSL